MTLREQIWRWLYAAGPTPVGAIHGAFPNLTRDTVRATCQRLARDGFLVGIGNTHRRAYAAVGTKPPHDMRGMSPGSRMGMDIGRAKAIERQKARFGVRVKPDPRRGAIWDVWV